MSPDGIAPGRVPRFGLDRSVRTTGTDGRCLLGGSPLRLFRLTGAGAALFERVRGGRSFDATPGEQALIGRWIDSGVIHPEPGTGCGPFDASDVTVVVPVRDRPVGVARLLASLTAASARPAGVVLVDDGSVDPAALEAAARTGDGDLAVTILRRAVPGGPGVARNDGQRTVRTMLVAFVDSDCRVDEDWLPPLLAQFGDPAVAVAAPRVRADVTPGEVSVLDRYEVSRSPLDMGADAGRVEAGTRISYVPSAALLVRSDVFDEVGGFDPEMRLGEDVDWIWRVVESGRRVRYVPLAGVRHETRRGLGSWLVQRVGYGSSAAALDERHPGRVAPVAASPWSAAVWGLVAVGHPLLGLSLALATTAQLRRKLSDVSDPEVLRLAMGGHLGAGRQFARAIVRVWWPIVVPLAFLTRRARRVLGVAVLCSAAHAVHAARSTAPGPGAGPVGSGPVGSGGRDVAVVDPVRFALLALLDDAAYGTGVWWGCWRRRSWRALLPSFGGRSEVG